MTKFWQQLYIDKGRMTLDFITITWIKTDSFREMFALDLEVFLEKYITIVFYYVILTYNGYFTTKIILNRCTNSSTSIWM
jgi:hypothetical protein